MIGRSVRWRTMTLAERARRLHEAWLDRAMTVSARGAYPRIPLRRVDEGGFDDVRAEPGARHWADRWWREAFTRVDEHDRAQTTRDRTPR